VKINSGLDWLRFTVSHDLQIEDILPYEWAIPSRTDQQPKAYPGYSDALLMEVGRIDWHMMRPEQKKMVTLTGDDLLKLRRRDFNIDLLLLRISKIPSLSVTRIDFAVDVVEPGIRANEVYEAYHRGGVVTGARKIKRVQTHAGPRDDDPATTVYIGSRQSMQMLRIYDKGKQQRIATDWVRIEIEVKGEKADRLLEAMLREGVYDAGCEAIRLFAKFDTDWYANALEGWADVDLSVGRKVTDWERWVRETVIPNFERAVRADTAGAREALRTLWERHKETIE